MPDHDGPEPRDARIPAELFRSTTAPMSGDLAAALDGLDRATRNFTRRLGEGGLGAERRRIGGAAIAEAFAAIPPAGPAEALRAPARVSAPQPDPSFDHQMREAEREAREYLESAKRRADSLVATMVGAVEHEAAEIRRGAEEGIRARWQQVEVDATRHVESARRVATQMVAERQERIATLSDGISDRAVALTAGMDDADQVRVQFDAFVRALSSTAEQISRSAAPGDKISSVGPLRGASPPSALAA